MRRILIFISFLLLLSCKKETVGDPRPIIDPILGNYDTKISGSSALHLLQAAEYDSLVIELQYMPGMRPQDATIEYMLNFLRTYLNKPKGISVYIKAAPSAGKNGLTFNDITLYTSIHRSSYTKKGIIAIYLLFADTHYATTSGMLGLDYFNTAICIFEKTIQEKSGGTGQASRVKVEAGILLHQFGHLLGLVNNFAPMVNNHLDPVNKRHCTDVNCLMYYSIETTGLMNILNNNIPTLDPLCEADLKANGGR